VDIGSNQKLPGKLDFPNIKNFTMKLFHRGITEKDIYEAKGEIKRITEKGAMECLNPFKKPFKKIPNLDISLNNWILVQKTPEQFLGTYLNRKFVEANLEGMYGTIQTLELYRCDEMTLKVTYFGLIIY